MRQVAAPCRSLTITEMQVNADGNLATRHGCARFLLLVVCRHALLRDLDVADEDIVSVLIEFTAAGSQRGDDAAPVGVAACQRALPER